MLENAERNIRWIETHRIPARDLGALNRCRLLQQIWRERLASSKWIKRCVELKKESNQFMSVLELFPQRPAYLE